MNFTIVPTVPDALQAAFDLCSEVRHRAHDIRALFERPVEEEDLVAEILSALARALCDLEHLPTYYHADRGVLILPIACDHLKDSTVIVLRDMVSQALPFSSDLQQTSDGRWAFYIAMF